MSRAYRTASVRDDAIENGAFEPVSKRTGLCFREMDFCRQRQTRRSGPNANFAFEGDKSRARNAANSGHSATIREISVRARLRGGPGRCPMMGWIKYLRRVRVETDALK